jgi:hypothetical protein
MSKCGAVLTCLVCLTSCRGARSLDPLRVEAEPAGANTSLTLLAAPGLRLNARLKPALELPDGRVIRFDSPHLTPDSAYFAEPPRAIAAGRQARWRGKLRASVCDAGQTVCRSVVLDL